MADGCCYISALPWDALLPLLPGDVADADPFFRRIGCIKASPIVNIHLWYDRAVMAEDFSAFVDSPLQWVFNKGSMASVDAPLSRENPGGSGDAHRICVSLSAAWEYIDLPRKSWLRWPTPKSSGPFPPSATGLVPLPFLLMVRRSGPQSCCVGWWSSNVMPPFAACRAWAPFGPAA